MGSETYHEPLDLLSEETKNLHRAVVSLIEELEAVDWYTQRAEACSDAELRAVLIHHRDEEIEHALMNLEWLRRNKPEIDANARTYLFTSGPITEVEEAAKAETGGAPATALGRKPAGMGDQDDGDGARGRGGDAPPASGPRGGRAVARTRDGSLGIGSLRQGEGR